MFEPIFRDAVPGVAGVTIYDKGHTDILGRYCIAKVMKLPTGGYRTHHADRCQRPAAIAYAQRFLRERAEKAGTTYTPGDGSETVAYKPLPVQPAA